MNRDIALRLDAMLMSQRGGLDMIANFLKVNLSQEDYQKYIKHVAKSMTETIDISNDLHLRYPDIIPLELK